MGSAQMIETLRRFPILLYVEEVNAKGRQAIDSEMRNQAASLFDFAEGMIAFETSLDHDARAVLNLVRDVLYTEKFLLENTKPRYTSYTNLHLLNRFLLEDRTTTLAAKWVAAKRALALIIRDWHERERDRLTDYMAGKLDQALLGYENENAAIDRIAHIKERERSLASLSQFAAVQGLPDTRIIQNDVHLYDTDWSYFAHEPARQMAHLTCLPRSRWHDEYMFLRTTQATECCFAGILAGFATLPPIIRRREFSTATEILKGTLFFSDFLTKLFAVFDTMPVSHFFHGFREATGDASAIQSVRFQTLEVLTRGLGEPKRSALSHQKETRFAFEWRPPREATLVGMCEMANEVYAEGSEFLEIAAMLDRDLYKWRARHFGIARKYLPSNAVGTGNEGIPYLESNFKSPRSATGLVDVKDDGDAHQNDAPARITLSFGLSSSNVPPVGIVSASGITSVNVQAALTDMNIRLRSDISANGDVISKSIEGYKQFFGNRAYPVQQQLSAFQRKAALPSPAIPALLLSLELKTGSLFGLHDLSRIVGQIVFDTASADESFVGINGKLIKCSGGELIVRDEHGIIASIFQGPDKRTAAALAEGSVEMSWVLLIFGHPSMPKSQFESLLSDARETMASIKATERNVWTSHER